jgi:hypothetical protein
MASLQNEQISTRDDNNEELLSSKCSLKLQARSTFGPIPDSSSLRSLGSRLNKSPQEEPWIAIEENHLRSRSGGVERKGNRPPTPDLPPRLAGPQGRRTTGGGGDDGPRCDRCYAKVSTVNEMDAGGRA